MKFLGILLIIAGICLLFSGAILVGVIIITLGAICIGAASKSKATAEQANKDREEMQKRQKREENERLSKQQEEENLKKEMETKELWIAQRTQALMTEGLLPSDAKIKAETEYVISKQKNDARNENPAN